MIANLKSKRSIYISKNIEKGSVISKENVKIVRPSLGLHPKFFKKIIGKKVKKKLYKGQRLKIEYID